ncbi:hypothetical protein Fmac_022344 [Flemingia macrophylla]|uniref:Small ribosomal subunit protein uS7 domain-containing protein n=1 Tax=Flemingia macrophylla TaxID=520843 RepID=A0ABD1LZF4_9FABA
MIKGIEEMETRFVPSFTCTELAQVQAKSNFSELVDAAKGNGDVVRKKEDTHRMVEANRAF